MIPPDRDKILGRIVALFELSKNNPFQHEATEAIRKAQKLMDKYQVEQHEIDPLRAESIKEIPVELNHGKQIAFWQASLMLTICKINAVRIVARRIGNRKIAYDIFGDQLSADLCLQLYWSVVNQLEIALQNTMRENPLPIHGRKYRTSFMLAAVEIIQEKLEAYRRQENADTSTTALVVLKDQLVNDYIRRIYGKLRSSSVTYQSDIRADRLGQKAGRDINPLQGIE